MSKPSHLFSAALVIFTAVLLTGCNDQRALPVDDSYLDSINAWRTKRLSDLKKPDGWLSLAGLFWLQEGVNRFGSDPDNHLTIRGVDAPAHLGDFILETGAVRFIASPDETIIWNGTTISEKELKADSSGQPTVLSHGSLSWYIIRRGERLAVRLKDRRNPRIEALKEIPMFPVDKKWVLEATLERSSQPVVVPTPTILGTVENNHSPGRLQFEYDGHQYALYPFGGSGDLFLVFGDLSNGEETYGGGRFLVVPAPDETGRTVIDFNRAYNPPCVFSAYATCPLPPDANRLPLYISAGEKMVGHSHH